MTFKYMTITCTYDLCAFFAPGFLRHQPGQVIWDVQAVGGDNEYYPNWVRSGRLVLFLV